jgi:hypothetical protein
LAWGNYPTSEEFTVTKPWKRPRSTKVYNSSKEEEESYFPISHFEHFFSVAFVGGAEYVRWWIRKETGFKCYLVNYS